MVRAPDFQFSLTAQYTVPLGDEWQAVFRADYQWQDDIFFSFYNHDLNAQKDYGLLNISGAVETDDGRWRLSAFAKNVFDKRYVISSASAAASGVATRSGHVGAPRMYGLSLAYKF